jgi:hypothetical protein
LRQELLINVTGGKPVPNLMVYTKPWYRDGAMIAMVLKQTGNLDLIKGWMLDLREPHDRNNGGETKADNLGQARFLISLASDKNHRLVPVIGRELKLNGQHVNLVKFQGEFVWHKHDHEADGSRAGTHLIPERTVP